MFGGDTSWGIGTYTPVSENYRNSSSYRATVATADGTYQRAPNSCWYAMGTALVTNVEASRITVTWSMTQGLWNTARLAGQVVSFCDSGKLYHGTMATGSTDTQGIISNLPSEYVPNLQPGDPLPYMIRPRAPRAILPGPIEVSTDGTAIHIQGNPSDAGFLVPEPATHLLYIGRRGENPQLPCDMESDATVAKQWIFAVEAISFQASSNQSPLFSLRSEVLTTDQAQWRQTTPWLAVGVLHVATSHIMTGVQYNWPYPADQEGRVWMVVPEHHPVDPYPSVDTLSVFLVRATSITGTPSSATVDGIIMTDGDRILTFGGGGGARIQEWSETSHAYHNLVQSLPANVLVLEEVGNRAWWTGDGIHLTPYVILMQKAHPVGRTTASLRATRDWSVPSSHAVVVLTRRSDGLYPGTPSAVTSNLGNISPTGWTWTYPLSTSDGTDRFHGPSATDGLLGLPRSLNASRDVDYACIRRRLGNRPLTDPRPPEYLRLNLDMGTAVVLKGFAWAVVMDGSYPTLTLHGSNDSRFAVDQVVEFGPRTAMGTYSRNEHHLAYGELMWQLCVDIPGST